MVAVDPFNPSLHIKKAKGEVHQLAWDVGGTYHGIEDIESAVKCASKKI